MTEHDAFNLSEEHLRDPKYALLVGGTFDEHFGITADPFSETDEYIDQTRQLNPRTAKGLVRYELEGSTAEWSDFDSSLIMYTARQLGVLGHEYSFAGEEVDAAVIAEGARSATLDRGLFALEAIAADQLRVRGGKLWVAGSDRQLSEPEIEAVGTWAPDARTGFDVADTVADRLSDEYADVLRTAGVSLASFHVEQSKPNTRIVTAEVIDRRRAAGDMVGSLAMATTALYVPFKTHQNLTTATPRGVHVVTRGVASRPEVVANRTVDTYLSEVATTLNSAARHLQATK